MAGWLVLVVLLAALAAEGASKTVINCPDDRYTVIGTDCYFISGNIHTGSSAHQYCKKNGGEAAVIESKEELDLLKRRVLTTTVYLGVSLQKYRTAQFEDALRKDGHTGFTAFDAEEPNNYGAEDCVIADKSRGFKWKDVSCTELHPVLCKAPGVVSEQPSCDNDQHLFNGTTCFWLSSRYGARHKWTEANEMCKRRGMELASLHSKEEQDFLWGKTGVTTWIGLRDHAAEGVFAWSDGTPLDFTSWWDGEPRGDEKRDCVVMLSGRDGKWSEWKCENYRSRVACSGPAS